MKSLKIHMYVRVSKICMYIYIYICQKRYYLKLVFEENEMKELSTQVYAHTQMLSFWTFVEYESYGILRLKNTRNEGLLASMSALLSLGISCYC